MTDQYKLHVHRDQELTLALYCMERHHFTRIESRLDTIIIELTQLRRENLYLREKLNKILEACP